MEPEEDRGGKRGSMEGNGRGGEEEERGGAE